MNDQKKPLAMSEEVARIHLWNIKPAYSRDFTSYPNEIDLTPSDKLPNPMVVLRQVGRPYIVPLRCDFCGKIGDSFQAMVLIWCNDCKTSDRYAFWTQPPATARELDKARLA